MRTCSKFVFFVKFWYKSCREQRHCSHAVQTFANSIGAYKSRLTDKQQLYQAKDSRFFQIHIQGLALGIISIKVTIPSNIKTMCTSTHTHHDCYHIRKYTRRCDTRQTIKSYTKLSFCPIYAAPLRMWSLNRCSTCTRIARANGKKVIKQKETRWSKTFREPKGGWGVIDWSGGRQPRRALDSPICSPKMTGR